MKKKPLAISHPHLMAQVHPLKNSGISVETISAKSNDLLWWVCEKGHEWQEKVSNRVRQKEPKCKICCSLACTHPELAKELHCSRNNGLKAEDITTGSSRKVWWKCPYGHEYEATVKNRAKNGSNCPHCQKEKLPQTLSFAEKNPAAAKMLHPTKNADVHADQISMHSKAEMCFQCDKEHEWKEPVNKIAKRSHKICPICSSLGYLKPELLEEWDPQNELSPLEISSTSNKKVWWLCKVCRYRWLATVANRFYGSGCPCCSGAVASKENSLAVEYPAIASEWDYSSNEKKPSDVTSGSDEIVAWICKNGHRFKESIYNRTKRGRGCKECKSLAYLRPDLNEEWHKSNSTSPHHLSAGSGRMVKWECKKCGYVWEAKIVDRYHGHGCPNCNSGWTITRIKLFVSSILPFIDSLTEAELYLLCLKAGLLKIDNKAKGKAFVKAFSTGKFPRDDLEKFVKNEPSLVDNFLNNQTASLKDDLNDETNDLSDDMIRSNGEEELPIIQAKEVLKSIDHIVSSPFGKEEAHFFVNCAVEKIWQHVFVDENSCIQQVEHFKESDGLYSRLVKSQFLEEYAATKALPIPEGYNFTIAGKLQQPNLMQLYTAYLLKTRKRMGNWSGTGAGKTLAAVLASRVIGAKLTVICCPNNVIDGWNKMIKDIYPDSHVFIKDVSVEHTTYPSQPTYLILNYEFFQSRKGRSTLKRFTQANQIDFVVIDEVHFSKQRDPQNVSIRKQEISSFLASALNLNDNLHILGMSATPVINNLFEGKTLLELVTGKNFDHLNTQATVPNCVMLHQQFVTHGIRFRPQYPQSLQIIKENVDCFDHIPAIKGLGLKPHADDLEGVLVKAKTPYILQQLRPKTLIYTHFWNKNGVLVELEKMIAEAGWSVATFTGEAKEGLKEFLEGSADVLIASSCIGTGVDGLQRICSRLIVACLPWTHAEFEQLKGRLYRQGQRSECVEVFVPLTYATVNGTRWSYCQSRWELIQFKKSVADATVDGVIPEGHLPTKAQVSQAAMALLHNLCS